MAKASPAVIPLWVDLDGNSAAPSGVPRLANQSEAFQQPLPQDWDECNVLIQSTAGVDPVITARLWVYHTVADDWFPLGIGAGASGSADPLTSGVINANSPLGEIVAAGDDVRHVEPVLGISGFSGIYLQALSIGGTSTPTFDAWLLKRRRVG